MWEVDEIMGRVLICSDSLPVDCALELVGDFGASKAQIAEVVLNALNAKIDPQLQGPG
jgi:hypothetical protein